MNEIAKLDGVGLGKNACRGGDLLQLKPIQGRSRIVCLNRTSFNIAFGKEFSIEEHGTKIILPYFGDGAPKFKISLIKVEVISGKLEDQYKIESLSSFPFSINGVLSNSSLISRKDTVEIFGNKFVFDEDKKDSIIKDEDILAYQSDLNILIEGETGVGKSRLAKIIHEKSGRSGEFLQLNLSSFSKSLLESELFGHKKGSFTGAVFDKMGALLSASKGTLFIDEIDSLPYDIQTKLLLFLDDKKVMPVGSSLAKKADVRLIFATGSSLEELVSKGRMRKDFYFRITSGHRLKINPLREDPIRVSEIMSDFENKNLVTIAPKLKNFYISYSWPGNVRQLQGHLQKKFALKKSQLLRYDDVDLELESFEVKNFMSKKIVPTWPTLKQMKKIYALTVYEAVGNSNKQASRMLKITPKTLTKLMQESISLR